jgi:hypothetical protein
LLPIPKQVKDDLRVWAAAMDTVVKGLPIPRRLSQHLPSALFFASDASGAQFNKYQGRFITIPYEGERGAASINTIEDDSLWFYATVTFPKSFLLEKRDSSDHAFGCKSSTLEAVGLILPFLCCPTLLIGRGSPFLLIMKLWFMDGIKEECHMIRQLPSSFVPSISFLPS